MVDLHRKLFLDDLRRGIDGLATIVRFQFKLDPYDKNTLFLFCGRRSDRIKALLWEGDGFLLMYKRLDNGAFRWPRSADEAQQSSIVLMLSTNLDNIKSSVAMNSRSTMMKAKSRLLGQIGTSLQL